MSKQRERTINRKALLWLVDHYASGRKRRICYRSQAETRRTLLSRSRRPDGLIVFTDGASETTIAIESKSRKTIDELRAPKYRPALAMAIAGVTAAVLAVHARAWPGATPTVALAFGAIVFCCLMLGHYASSRAPSALRQVMRYPANERWLAVPADCWRMLDAREQRFLDRRSSKVGVGILVVSRLGAAEPVRAPALRRASALRRYKDAARARGVLSDRAFSSPHALG